MKKTEKTSKTTKEKKNEVKVALDHIHEQPVQTSLLQPSNLVQRFWQNTVLRITTGVVVLLILAIGGGLTIYINSQPASSRIIDYVPDNAWLYVEFDIQSDEWTRLTQQSPRLVEDLNDEFISRGMTQNLINLAQRIALVEIATEDNKSLSAWLVKTDQPQQLELLVPPDTFVKQLSDSIAVFSVHEGVIRQFKQQRPWEYVTFVPKAQRLWFGFVHTPKLVDLLDAAPDVLIAPHVMAKQLAPSDERVFFQIDQRNHELLLTIDGLESNAQPTGSPKTVQPVIEGADVVATYVTLPELYTSLNDAVQSLPLPHYYWQQAQSDIIERYHWNLDDVLALFSAPVHVYVDIDERAKVETDFTTAWDIIHQPANNALIVIDTALSDEQVSQLTDSIASAVAYHTPQVVERTLPDGSLAQELVVSRDQVVFEELTKGNSQLLQIPELEKEIIVKRSDAQTFISTSQRMIDEYNSGIHTSVIPTTSACSGDADEYFYLSGNVLKHVPHLQYFSYGVIETPETSLNVCLGL